MLFRSLTQHLDLEDISWQLPEPEGERGREIPGICRAIDIASKSRLTPRKPNSFDGLISL